MADKSKAEIAAAVRAYVPPRLTLEERLSLARAPKKPMGTQVTVRAYPVRQVGGIADHMYEEFDDGRDQYIYRGGPEGSLLHAEATPARQSRDFGRGTRVVDQFFLPNVSASDAFEPARLDSEQINQSGRRYGIVQSNSNTVIGNHTQRQFGKRVGDARTPGYRPPDLYPKPAPMPGVYPMTMPVW